MSVLVLIKNMRMPTSCYDCNCFIRDSDGSDYCCLLMQDIEDNNKRDANCPLVSIPSHGRLIDADEITEHKYTTIPTHKKEYADGEPKSDEEIIAFKCGWNYAIDAIVDNAPTIIEAEEVSE